MQLVLDTNILLAALIRSSNTRLILLHPSFRFFLHEHALQELAKHKNLVVQKSGISGDRLELLLDMLLEQVTIVPAELCEPSLAEARRIMDPIDPHDAPFLALALSFQNDGLWTQDRDFGRQQIVRIWKTEDLLRLLTEGKIR